MKTKNLIVFLIGMASFFSCSDKSGAEFDSVLTVMVNYGLSGDMHSFEDSLAYAEIAQNNRPFLMGGTDLNSNEGHTWIVDGLRQYRIQTTNTYMWYLGYMPGASPSGEPATQEEAMEAALDAGLDHPEDLMVTQEVIYAGPHKLFHMNWGENGNANGYYLKNESVTFGNINHLFTSNQKMIYNIRSNAN